MTRIDLKDRKILYELDQNSRESLTQIGKKVPKTLQPRGYIKNYQINNLWRYDLPDGWRLIYSSFEDKIMIINLILEWFTHKDYEKRFGY